MCVCVLKKDDISIDWSSWSVVGSIVLTKRGFEYGLSSSQIRTNDIRNVVLLVVDPSSLHHYIFWVWPMLLLVHILMEFHLPGNSDELLLSPSVAFCLPPWIMLNINLVLETCVSISSCFVHEAYVWMKEWLPLIHVHLVKVAAVNLRKLVLLPLESSQVSHAYVRSILWSGDLQPSFHMCPEHTKPLIDLFKEKKFLLKSIPYARILISSLMVPPPELGSVLL